MAGHNVQKVFAPTKLSVDAVLKQSISYQWDTKGDTENVDMHDPLLVQPAAHVVHSVHMQQQVLKVSSVVGRVYGESQCHYEHMHASAAGKCHHMRYSTGIFVYSRMTQHKDIGR